MFEKVKELIIENLSCDGALITLEAELMKDLGMDSLDAVEFSMALEEEFGITIEEEALADFKQVSDVVTYLEQHVEEA